MRSWFRGPPGPTGPPGPMGPPGPAGKSRSGDVRPLWFTALGLVIVLIGTAVLWQREFVQEDVSTVSPPLLFLQMPGRDGAASFYSRWRLQPPDTRRASEPQTVSFSGTFAQQADFAQWRDEHKTAPWYPPTLEDDHATLWMTSDLASGLSGCYEGSDAYPASARGPRMAFSRPTDWDHLPPVLTDVATSIALNYLPSARERTFKTADAATDEARRVIRGLVGLRVPFSLRKGFFVTCLVKRGFLWLRNTTGYTLQPIITTGVVSGSTLKTNILQSALVDVDGRPDFYYDHGGAKAPQVIGESWHWFTTQGLSEGHNHRTVATIDVGQEPVFESTNVSSDRDLALLLLGALLAMAASLGGAFLGGVVSRISDRARMGLE